MSSLIVVLVFNLDGCSGGVAAAVRDDQHQECHIISGAKKGWALCGG